MTADTKFADVSEFQVDVNNRYPYRFLSFRSNDGTYRDTHFAMNLAWSKHACESNRMDGFIVYFVFEENWLQTVETFKAQVGRPHRRMAVMIDVENWSGKIRGDHSHEINECRQHVADWLGSYMTAAQRRKRLHARRVLGYANLGDFANLWPHRGDVLLVEANYSYNAPLRNKIAHQYSDRENTPPFGPCDINSADGLTPVQFAEAIGLTDVPNPKPVPVKPPSKGAKKPPPKHRVVVKRTHAIKSGETFSGIAKHYSMSIGKLHAANPQVHNINEIYAGEILYIP